MLILEPAVNEREAATSQDDLLAMLRRVFGFDHFRPYQEDIVSAIVAGRDAFVVMPTGGGKSLCYQLPAHVVPGLCVVISPLISLMKDQVDAAKENGLRAAFMNSSQTVAERNQVEQALVTSKLDLLYVSPERFAMATFKQRLCEVPLAFIAIDEAHCISEWGHDFRPDYLALSDIVQRFPDTPVAAFTATATMKVQQDIITKLGLRNPHRVRASFNRSNLYYQVQAKHNPEEQVLRFIRSHPNEQGIIYRTTRKDVEATAAFLQQHGVKALPYHAGMEDEARIAHQEAFNRDAINVVVATIAFGMGIDKSNVRFVIHADLPKSIEGYYQETGRAGRDGEPAHCLLLFNRADAARIRYFIDKIDAPEARAHAQRCLQDMIHYGSTRQCRRRQLLGYFNETYPERNCRRCDICAGQVATPSAQAQSAASACNEHLFEELRVLRKRCADEQGVPPFVIFSDRSLRAMATRMPSQPAAMASLHGIGAHKLQHYGTRFCEAIASFKQRHPEAKPMESTLPLSTCPEPLPVTCRVTGNYLDCGYSINEIANERGLAVSTIAGHVEQLIRSGHPVDIDRLIDPQRRRHIEACFARSGSRLLAPVVKDSPEPITYEEARLVRGWLTRHD